MLGFYKNIRKISPKAYYSEKFSAEQRKVILKAISGLSNHPSFAADFESLRKIGAIINIHPVTRSDQIQEDEGGTLNLNDDGTVSAGRVVNIYIRLERGGKYTLAEISIIVVHELIHALGVPAFSERLDSPDSNWDIEIRNDIFKGYNFEEVSSNSDGSAPIIAVPDSANRLLGGVGGSVFIGSLDGNIFMPVAGGNLLYTKSGDDEVRIEPGGMVDRLVNGGGSTIIDFFPAVQFSSISILRSSDHANLSLLVAGKPELIIEGASIVGTAINVRIAGQLYPLSSFATFDSNIADFSEAHIDHFGAYSGEAIGSVAVANGLGTRLYYRIGEVSGVYAAEAWVIDLHSGVLIGQFTKPDLGGSEFTSLTVVASDGITDTLIAVTVRWAYSNEFEPTL